MVDIQVLALLGTRDAWVRYADHIKPDRLEREARAIYRSIGEYYESHDVDELDWIPFASWFKHCRLPASQSVQGYDMVFTKLETAEAGQHSAVLTSLRDRYYAHKIADVALRASDNEYGASLADIQRLLAQRDSEVGIAPRNAVLSEDIDILLQSIHSGTGLKWRLRELNISLGPLHQGDLLCLGARPEVGKTTWLASEATHMAAQLPEGKHVLWINNEEESRRVKLRCVQAALGARRAEIALDPQRAKARYVEVLGDWDRIIIVEAGGLGVRQIERLLAQSEPGLIVFDQLRKVRGFSRGERSDVQRLALLYGWARSIAKQYAPVLIVHQAGASAVGELYPRDDMLEGCRTEIQGELDVQIMMGRLFEPGREYSRGLNIVKNKLPSPGDETMRHARWEVTIRPDIARFESGVN